MPHPIEPMPSDAMADDPLKPGDPDLYAPHELPELRILWQDAHLVAIHKPAGWLVHRTGLDAHETRIVQPRLRDQLGQWGYPIHRLDKGTSGVLLLALDPDSARLAAQAFAQRRVHKRYLAMVRGWPAEGQVTVDHPLRPDDAPPDAPAQAAQTHLRRLATLSLDVPVDRYPTTRAALMLAEPETGRRHQIRRHLKHLSHPILGDATHGKGAHNRWWASHLGAGRLWLHAWSLSLDHPVSGQALALTSPLDASFNTDWRQLLRSQPWLMDAGLTGEMAQAIGLPWPSLQPV
jgi:tRNA pseudouridine65 synthase